MAGKKKQKNSPVRVVKRKRRQRTLAKLAGLDVNSIKYAKLLMNPCNEELVYPPSIGSSEGGYLVRVYKRYVMHSTAANNCGMFMWQPGFHCYADGGHGFNVFKWETNSPSLKPLNTVATPFGSGGASGETDDDPAGLWVASTNVSSARTVAACMRVYYTGQLSAAAGSVAVVNSMSHDQMLESGGGTPPSVNGVMGMAPSLDRIPIETREIRWAPGTGDLTYKARSRPQNPEVNAPFTVGVPGTSTTQTTTAGNGCAGLAVAWQGLAAGATNTNDLIIECIKVIEWLPDAVGLTQPSNNPRPKSTYETIVGAIDDTFKGWRDSFTHSAAQNVINTAQAGVGLYGSILGLQRGMNRLRM